ncbi:hypothetical protein GCM10022243_15230 [Saccharothrix violaceirubra]|uniref:Excreted virulence factor EspC (Type VII ESX diderm) n=1 Tax=Saccharothrix violaceirubra TaxID=413306 RepID=A0A7W7WXF7_9PSEU|nr:type VII secretion target [Saccharothrix violaceirubra]MBB4967399.1 hypothetical protein [Saccharothrix violaceirubra]
MTGFGTSADNLDEHADYIEDVLAPDVREAVEAAGRVKLGDDSMGLLCQVYSFVFDEELDTARDLLRKLPDALDATAGDLHATATGYRTVDSGESTNLDGMNR